MSGVIISPFDRILGKFNEKHKAGNGFNVKCPVLGHNDKKASLSIDKDYDGTVLLHCHAGCQPEDVVNALGLEMKDLFPAGNNGFKKNRSSKKVTLEDLARSKGLDPGKLTGYGVEQYGQVMRIKYFNMDGKPSARQRLRVALSGTDGSCWEKGSGSPVPYGIWRVNEFAEKHDYLVLVEGESDTWTLWHYDIPALGIPGASMANKLKAAYIDRFKKIYIWKEPDHGGDTFINGISNQLTALKYGGQALIIHGHDGVKDPNELHKKYPGEFLQQWNNVVSRALAMELKKVTHSAKKTAALEESESSILINAGVHSLKYQMSESWRALQQQEVPLVFNRAGMLTRVAICKKTGPKLEALTESGLKVILDKVANWYRIDKDGNEKSAFPSSECTKGMLSEASSPVPTIDRVVQSPVIARDGTLLTEDGFHEKAETWHFKTCDIPTVSERPTREEVQRARDLFIRELLVDFPVEDKSSIAYAMSAVITPFIRQLISGPTPLHLIDAKSGPGTGKTLLADMIVLPSTGRPAPAIAEGRDGDEWRKRITAKLLDAGPYVCIDNVNRRLDSGELAAAITATIWEDRLLGQTKMIQLPVETCWLATGNAVLTSAEISRRIVRIRLDAGVENPFLRDAGKFKHKNLRTWAMENRGNLIWAALTLCKAWIAYGKPLGDRTLGMFESWASVIGGILNVAEIPGFLTNLVDMYQDMNEETATWREFIAAWYENHSGLVVGINTLYRMAEENDLLLTVLGGGTERAQKTRLGMALARVEGRHYTVDGIRCRILRAGSKSRSGAKLYKLEYEKPDKVPWE